MHAFRCKTCGHLVRAAAAGERTHPGACPVCKAGIDFNPHDVQARDALKTDLVAAVEKKDVAAIDSLIVKLHKMPLKKTFVADNWEVLADAPAERLAELGIDAALIERHEPFVTRWVDGAPVYEPKHRGATLPPSIGRHHERLVAESPGSTDAVSAK